MNFRCLFAVMFVCCCYLPVTGQNDIDRASVVQAMHRATEFMTSVVADHGGYAWVSGPDGKLSHGEGVAGPDRIWVQPPGTPAVGMAFLKAYQATGDSVHLDAARAVGTALVQGQLRSGGWGYSISFDAASRAKIPYRVGPKGGRDLIPEYVWPGGWEIWRKRKQKTNLTLLDDDTTPAAIRFLVRLDEQLEFVDSDVHDAATYALASVLTAQYPVGAWSHNYDRYNTKAPSETHYPVVRASYPETWSRKWDKKYDGCYHINDRITLSMIETMLLAARVYNDDRYWLSARRGGKFLILAQLPDPQPAWAQQYDHVMQPVWERKFEPPAITAGESQDVLRTLMQLYRETKDEQFLAPIPKALAYLKTCLRDDGKLARFYELKTNRPIYFNKDYEMTTDDSKMPDHYGFVRTSRLKSIEREYKALLDGKEDPQNTKLVMQRAKEAIASQSKDGAWLEPGYVRNAAAKKVVPEAGVVHSQTFIDNIEVLTAAMTALDSNP